jgi:hypothetical protein
MNSRQLAGATVLGVLLMDQLKDDTLRAYSVGVPILTSDVERAVPNATKRLPDN